jgi:hypothetical protein
MVTNKWYQYEEVTNNGDNRRLEKTYRTQPRKISRKSYMENSGTVNKSRDIKWMRLLRPKR